LFKALIKNYYKFSFPLAKNSYGSVNLIIIFLPKNSTDISLLLLNSSSCPVFHSSFFFSSFSSTHQYSSDLPSPPKTIGKFWQKMVPIKTLLIISKGLTISKFRQIKKTAHLRDFRNSVDKISNADKSIQIKNYSYYLPLSSFWFLLLVINVEIHRYSDDVYLCQENVVCWILHFPRFFISTMVTSFVKFNFQALHQIDYQNKFVCVRIIYSQLKALVFFKGLHSKCRRSSRANIIIPIMISKTISERFDESMLDFCSPPAIYKKYPSSSFSFLNFAGHLIFKTQIYKTFL
jgi:hypothetical protein